jgi:hypothetical protein
MTRWTGMVPSLDIFRIESGGVLWCETAATIETAKARIQKLALSSPGGYLILNQRTGQRIPVMPGCSPQIESPSVESGHHGPRVGMG